MSETSYRDDVFGVKRLFRQVRVRVEPCVNVDPRSPDFEAGAFLANDKVSTCGRLVIGPSRPFEVVERASNASKDHFQSQLHDACVRLRGSIHAESRHRIETMRVSGVRSELSMV